MDTQHLKHIVSESIKNILNESSLLDKVKKLALQAAKGDKELAETMYESLRGHFRNMDKPLRTAAYIIFNPSNFVIDNSGNIQCDVVTFDNNGEIANDSKIAGLRSFVVSLEENSNKKSLYFTKQGQPIESKIAYSVLKQEIESNDTDEEDATNIGGDLPRYKVEVIHSYDEANRKIGQYSDLCFSTNETAWLQFSNRGTNKCYLLTVDGYENMSPKEYSSREAISPHFPSSKTNNPSAYDTYGMSLIVAFITPDGKLASSNTRHNHGGVYGNRSVDQAFNLKEVNILAGQSLVGYTEEELDEKGALNVTFENCQQLLDNGIEPEKIFDEVDEFQNGFAIVELNDKFNFIDNNHKLLTPNLWFDWLVDFKGGVARANLGSKWNFINTKGEFISPNLWFDDVVSFDGSIGEVKLGEKWNFIVKNGEILSPNLWFDDVDSFYGGVARVRLNGKWNYFDEIGTLLSKDQWFDHAYEFRDGRGLVLFDNEWFFIDHNGVLHREERTNENRTLRNFIRESVMRELRKVLR